MPKIKQGLVIRPEFDHYSNLPDPDSLINPLTDIPIKLKEANELTEFVKLCNEWYSPEYGVKYLVGTNLYPYQMAIVRVILGHRFPILLLSRGAGKSFLLGVFAVYYAIMNPGAKIVLVSASFRQSKLIFAEIQKMYDNSPLLRAISDDQPRISTDNCHYSIGGSIIKALPLGSGEKIRGERGHVILADEISSIPIEVFDVVVRGFAATQQNPWHKTRDALMRAKESEDAQNSLMRDRAMSDFMLADGNKIVLSGTAGFKNGTFYRLYSQYSRILSNKIKGKVSDYREIFKDENIDDEHQIDHEDYAIVKFTYRDLPPNMMELRVIDNARATMPKFLFNMEYMCEFAEDGYGFFKMRDIENATSTKSGFHPLLRGNDNRVYVMGVDPARTFDRFAICIIELGSPNKVVFMWTAQNKPYSYSVARMRELMRLFNIKAIAIDEGGGGLAVEEMLNKSDVCGTNDKKVFRSDSEDPASQQGSKILHMITFGVNWIEEANVLLQKNIEDRVIMFPYQQMTGEYADDKDELLFEINELKTELVAIEVTHTKTGKKHFDLAPPNIKKDSSGTVKHKDRYSALLLANYLASKFAALTTDDKAKVRQDYYNSCDAGGFLENIGK